MRLLHILGDSKFGGGSIIISQLASRAVAEGWTVDVLTTDPVFQSWLRNAGVGVVDLDVIWREIRPLKDLNGVFQLSRFLRRSRYHVVHTHTSKAGFVGRLAAAFARVPVIVHTVHGFAFHEASSRKALLAYSSLERVAAMSCHRIITVSEYHREWALRLGIGTPEKVVAVPNGIPEAPVVDPSVVAELRRANGCSPDDMVLVSTGRLAAQKGLAYLLKALPAIRSEVGPRLKLWLAGDGPLRGELESLSTSLGLQQTVRFLGFRRDIHELLAAADLVVLPSLWEGLSIALLEAMAAGRPIVTTGIGSNIEVTRNGDAADLVPPADSPALSTALTRLIADPGRQQLLASRAQTIFRSSYTEGRMLDSYMQQYRELAAASQLLARTAAA